MVFALIILRLILGVWILGILGLLLYKISTKQIKSTNIDVLFLFPILLLTRKGRNRIKEELK
ncbi:MAG: hypothetical protein IJY58_02865 [Alphaproteobacteria bacterium]|nr:hypothetical protein [Alphaproteobacteria bacterium]MBQ9089970.1 hypothetical protein [Alphaproteobacteria bacterium]